MQTFIHCKTTVHVSGVTAPIIRSIKYCNRSLQYRSYYLYRYSPPWSDRDAVPIRPCWRLRLQYLTLLMMGAVTPETCRVVLQWINVCTLLHLLDFYSHWIMMHGTTSLKNVWKTVSAKLKFVLSSVFFNNLYESLRVFILREFYKAFPL